MCVCVRCFWGGGGHYFWASPPPPARLFACASQVNVFFPPSPLPPPHHVSPSSVANGKLAFLLPLPFSHRLCFLRSPATQTRLTSASTASHVFQPNSLSFNVCGFLPFPPPSEKKSYRHRVTQSTRALFSLRQSWSKITLSFPPLSLSLQHPPLPLCQVLNICSHETTFVKQSTCLV